MRSYLRRFFVPAKPYGGRCSSAAPTGMRQSRSGKPTRDVHILKRNGIIPLTHFGGKPHSPHHRFQSTQKTGRETLRPADLVYLWNYRKLQLSRNESMFTLFDHTVSASGRFQRSCPAIGAVNEFPTALPSGPRSIPACGLYVKRSVYPARCPALLPALFTFYRACRAR